MSGHDHVKVVAYSSLSSFPFRFLKALLLDCTNLPRYTGVMPWVGAPAPLNLSRPLGAQELRDCYFQGPTGHQALSPRDEECLGSVVRGVHISSEIPEGSMLLVLEFQSQWAEKLQLCA